MWDDTPANLASNNPTLLKGEIVIERGSVLKMKIGDGTTTWNSLPYYGGNVVISTTNPATSDYQFPVGTMWFRNNDSNTPSRAYYLESVVSTTATWRKIITDQDLATYALASHVHGNLTSDGKIGSAAGKVITTTTGGVVQAEDQRGAFNKDFEPLPGNILMNGSASVGSSGKIAHSDHRHPSDTTKINTSEKGVANGVATLDAGGKVPSSQLPSYVDETVEVVDFVATLPTSGLTVGQIYFNTTDNKLYTATSTTAFGAGVNPAQSIIYVRLSNNAPFRWTGSTMQVIDNPLDYVSQAEAENGTENTKVMTALRVFQAILKWIQTKTLTFFGTFTVSNSAITGSDTILSAFGKAQGQINNKEELISAAAAVTTFNPASDVLVIQVAGVTKRITGSNAKTILGILGYDNVTIGVSGGNYYVKDGSITNAKLAGLITSDKITSVAVRALILDGDTFVLNGKAL
ncbi:MAG: hypothetical protein CVU04_04000 [Bacteroidetes bacterium HGW-Bacteroidetes-20]|nr:MAG: hypothetical protein CVU04_04000 [Bacteroidetes bacterium HGW-Bacteroidetes-20]